MNISRALLVVAAAVTTTATGCAAAPAPEAKGQSHANEEIDQGGGDPNTLFLKVDGQSVYYDDSAQNAIFVSVCASRVDPALVDQINGINGQVHLVLQKQDGSFDTRLASTPLQNGISYLCGDGPNGGLAYEFQLFEQDASFISHDLSAAFVSGFSGKHIDCDGGFDLSHGLDIDIQGFRVENGTLQRPDVTVRFEGETTAALTAHCSLHATKPGVFAVGPVPVYYELEIGVGLTFSVSKAAHLHARVGTTGGDLDVAPADGGDAPTFTITPEVDLGVTFYGLIGASVGVGLPITVAPNPPCSPNVTMSAEVTIGVEAGLLGFHDIPITKALKGELSTEIGPFPLLPSTCPPDPVASMP